MGYEMHCHDSLERLGHKGWLYDEACAAAMHGHTIRRGSGGVRARVAGWPVREGVCCEGPHIPL